MTKPIGITIVITVVALSLAVSSLWAEAPPRSDLERSLDAKLIFTTDSLLKQCRLGVQVQGDTVTVSGAVPDLATKEHLGRLMLTMPGIRTVMNDCHIVPPLDPAIVTIKQLMRGDTLDKAVPSPSLSVPSRQQEPVYVRGNHTPTKTQQPEPVYVRDVKTVPQVMPTAQVKQAKTPATLPHQTTPVEKTTVSLYEPGNYSTADMNADQLKDRINAILGKDERFTGLSWQADAKHIRLVGQVEKSKWITEVGELLYDVGGGRFIDVGQVQARGY